MLAFLAPRQADAAKRYPKISQGAVPPSLRGVEQEYLIRFPMAIDALPPELIELPHGLGLELILPLSEEVVRSATKLLSRSYVLRITPLSTGVRLLIAHGDHNIIYASGVEKVGREREYHLRIGWESEESRLRHLADSVRQPLPIPDNLGAQLELWQDAERAMYENNVELAMQLWGKLEEQPALRDLAELRQAELFIMTGHVNEATRRLRDISRQYPRSTGAALARLSALHLEAIVDQRKPSPDQLLIAARSGNRANLRAFADLRAVQAIVALRAPDFALENPPRIDQLPEYWQTLAHEALDNATAQTVLVPAIKGDDYRTVVEYFAWREQVMSHPKSDILIRYVSDALSRLGMYEESVPLYRKQLRLFPRSDEEARIAVALAQAYSGLNEQDHALEVTEFLVHHHPNAPGVANIVLSTVLKYHEKSKLEGARKLLERFRSLATTPDVQRGIYAVELQLLHAWGTPAQQIQTLLRMRDVGFDDQPLRETQLAMAYARDGQSALAEPKLRRWLNQTKNPELRDELAYLLADAEFKLDRPKEARKILSEMEGNGTRWGLVARTRLREVGLDTIIGELERVRKNPPGKR